MRRNRLILAVALAAAGIASFLINAVPLISALGVTGAWHIAFASIGLCAAVYAIVGIDVTGDGR